MQALKPEPVHLGASAPASVRPGGEFTARFVAYPKAEESQVEAMLTRLSPGATSHLDLKTCRWKTGTEVTVKLTARGLRVSPEEQKIVWEAKHALVEFDVEVPDSAAEETVVLKFDALVDGIVVAMLRMDLEINRETAGAGARRARGIAARTAFASYSSQDRQRVLDRVAAVRISAGLDIFLDCLSLHPGEQWKPRLEEQIRTRDLFLLFWSKPASESEWVTWEWETALHEKSKDAFQIHPLEAGIRPPEALKDLHFGDVFMLIRKAGEPFPPASKP